MANTTTPLVDFARTSLGYVPGQAYLRLPLSVSWTEIITVSTIFYAALYRASYSRMTNEEAHRIVRNVIYYEFPLFYDLSLRFALFKTYAMRNVAQVLGNGSDLSKPRAAGKRYEDTAVLYSCFATYAPTSELFRKAVARTNFLHAPYLKSGKMLNEDLLYVLYASMVEPVNFMRQYEWRPLTDMEVAAIGTFWKYIGEGMQINYKAELGREHWEDGIDFFEDVKQWSVKYEDRNMGPFEHVHLLGQVSMDLLLTSYPKFSRPLAHKMFLVLMGDRLRHAFGMPEPGIAVSALTYTALLLRQKFVRYLSLPRIIPNKYLSEQNPKTGRINHYSYMKEPWYNAPTFASRWNPEALVTWASGGLIPGDAADMKPEGFLFEDLGPRGRMGTGTKEAPEMENLVGQSVSGGCPFMISK